MFNNSNGQFPRSIPGTTNVDPREIFGHPPEQVVFHQNPNNSAAWFQFRPSPMSVMQDFTTDQMNLKTNSQKNEEIPKFDFESILKSQINQINPTSTTQNIQSSNDFDAFLGLENTKPDNSPFLTEKPAQNEEYHDPDFDVFKKPKDLLSFQENISSSKQTETKQNSNDIFGLLDQVQSQKAVQSNPSLDILSNSNSDPDFDVFNKKSASNQPLLFIDSATSQPKNEMNLIDFSIPKIPQKQQNKQRHNSNDLISFDMTKRKETNNLIQFNKNLEKENLKKQKEEIEKQRKLDEIKKRKEEQEKQKRIEEMKRMEEKQKEEQRRLEEQKRIEEEKQKRIEEEKQKKLEEEEQRRLEEQKRIEEEKRREELEKLKEIEEEQKRLKEMKRIEEEKRLREEQEKQKMLEEQKKLEEERIAEMKRIEEEKRQKEELENKRKLEEQKQREELQKQKEKEEEQKKIEEEKKLKEEKQRKLEEERIEGEKHKEELKRQRKINEEEEENQKKLEEKVLFENTKSETNNIKTFFSSDEDNTNQEEVKWEFGDDKEFEGMEVVDLLSKDNDSEEENEINNAVSRDVDLNLIEEQSENKENSSNQTKSEAKFSDFGESLIKKEENQTISFQFDENKNDNLGGFFSFDDEKKEETKLDEPIINKEENNSLFENSEKETDNLGGCFSFDENETETKISEMKESSIKTEEIKPSFQSLEENIKTSDKDGFNPSFPTEDQLNNEISKQETDNLGGSFDFDETETKISEMKESSIKNEEFEFPSDLHYEEKSKEENKSKTETKISNLQESLIQKEEFNPSFPAEDQFGDKSTSETDNLGGFFDFGENEKDKFENNETETKVSEMKESLIKSEENTNSLPSEIHFEDNSKEENHSETETKINDLQESLIEKEEFNPSFPEEFQFNISKPETENLGGFFDFDENEKDKIENNETETKISEMKESSIKNEEFDFPSDLHFEEKSKEENKSKTETKISGLQESLIQKEEFNPSFPEEFQFNISKPETENLGGFFDFDENEKEETQNTTEEKTKSETKISDLQESSINKEEIEISFPTEDQFHSENQEETKDETENQLQNENNENQLEEKEENEFGISFPTEEFNVSFPTENASELKTDNLSNFFSSDDEKEKESVNVSFPTENLMDEENHEKSEITPEISFQTEEKENEVENSENFDISEFKIHFFDPEKEAKSFNDNLILKNNFATTKFKVLQDQYEQKQKANENNLTIEQINNMIVNENSQSTSVVFVNESQTHDEVTNLNETEEIGNLEIDEIIEPKNLQIDNEEINSIKEITAKEEQNKEEINITKPENEESKLAQEESHKEPEETPMNEAEEENQEKWIDNNPNESVEFTEEFENFVEKIENEEKETNESSHSVETHNSRSIDDIEADTNLFIFPEFIPLDESIEIEEEEKEENDDNSNFVSSYINKIKKMKEKAQLKPIKETISYKIFDQYFRENFK
ncbi:hypothetical protein TVAG_252980 [Trichomonas vaginalis G3]|uniref:Uncharacterized protein n=1 Tax=Trichomonas vaginalis (strain ATCC PRA-98 / G3) TaxID=412133 RepID=A2EXF7_TRIV3|nr:cytoskeletal protein binding [Trichomonas vaginalis G3]EAY02647.1 hypothetical protein TVAG_252980 [Trichomonas vaginalis G3]KAI5550144.1 cytoskeletal protein binding [Trichomonas vaginalis G3]|eukprot:XP_001314870.1 hypothetical protein [Trichomonas vaginalis G3]